MSSEIDKLVGFTPDGMAGQELQNDILMMQAIQQTLPLLKAIQQRKNAITAESTAPDITAAMPEQRPAISVNFLPQPEEPATELSETDQPTVAMNLSVTKQVEPAVEQPAHMPETKKPRRVKAKALGILLVLGALGANNGLDVKMPSFQKDTASFDPSELFGNEPIVAASPSESAELTPTAIAATPPAKGKPSLSPAPSPTSTLTPEATKAPTVNSDPYGLKGIKMSALIGQQAKPGQAEALLTAKLRELIRRTPQDQGPEAVKQAEFTRLLVLSPEEHIMPERMQQPGTPLQRLLSAWVQKDMFKEGETLAKQYSPEDQLRISIAFGRMIDLSADEDEKQTFLRAAQKNLAGVNIDSLIPKIYSA